MGRRLPPEPASLGLTPPVQGADSALAPPAPWWRTTFSSLRVRDFRLFFIGQGISLTGTWMRRTALGWLVYQLTGSRVLLGTVMALSLLPMFVLSPLAGAIADRVDKRRLIILTQILASACSAAMAAVVLLGVVRPWQLMALATLGGVAFAFEVPSRQAYVAELVGRRQLLNAVALNSLLVNLSRIFGPSLAGLLMASLGIGFCFLLDAVSYLFVIAMLRALRTAPAPVPARLGSHWQELMEGFREVSRNRRVRVLLLLLVLTGVFGWSVQTLMPAIAQDILGLDELHYGILMSMFGVGAIAGALTLAGRSLAGGSRRQVFGGVWALCLGGLMVAASRSVVPMTGGLALAGFGAVLFLSTANTLVQTSIDDSLRGRVMGIWSVGFGGSLPLGAFLSGWVAELVSPFLTIALFSATLALASGLVWWRLPRRRPAA